MIIITDNPGIEWILKDDRSMSDILEQAVKHYSRYQKTKDPGERFAYLVEMRTLMDRMKIAPYLSERMDYRMIAKNLFEIMTKSLSGNRGFDDYSVNQLGSLAYILGQIEKNRRRAGVHPGKI